MCDRSRSTMPIGVDNGPRLCHLLCSILISLNIVLASQCIAFALNPSLRVSQYTHATWRIQDGSLPAGMFSIAQTADGFLWTVSLSGDVYRFDGVQFLPWRKPDDMSTNAVGKIFADHAGGLWVEGEGLLVHLKDGVVTSRFKLDGTHGFQTMSEDADGSLWIGLRASDAPLCRVAGQDIKCFGKDDGIAIGAINAILSDGSGGLWLGGPTALVHWHQGSVAEQYQVNALITSLARAPDGTLWVGMLGEGPGMGLQQLKQGAFKSFVTSTFDGSKFSVTSLMVDHDGNLWVATDAQGLFRIHGDAVEHYGHTDGLSGDSVWAFFEDREGIVWAGTTSGIDSFRVPRVVTFSSTQGLGKDLAAGILAGRDGSIWVANAGSLDRIKDEVVSSINRGNGLPGNQVASMLEDRAGNMWVGVDDGLYLFKDGRFRRLPEPDHKPLGMVVGITEDVDGNIWAECGRPRKLVRIRDFQVREVFPESQVPPGHNIAADPRGGIWIETREGDVVRFRNGVLETKIPLKRVGSPLNRQIIVEADGSVLVGSENGLVGWRAGKLQTMTTKNGLPCDFVIAFIKDQEKRWWLYTRCGVVEFADSELQRWWANPDTIIQNRVYDAFDGAQPNIGSFNSAALSSDGRVWFSSGVVVQMLEPSREPHKAVPAQTYIQSVFADRKEFALTDNLKLGPNPRELQINYTSPTLLIPQRVKFRYRLDGYDHDWHDAGTRREAFYTDLPPGNYSLSVIACNSDGVWSANPAKFNFSVMPAFYQTTWFRLALVFVFLALLWAAYRLRIRQLAHAFNMTLEARVSERTRIARELHDTLLQSFQGLLLRFQLASQLFTVQPAQAKQTLDSAIDQASNAIGEARDAVQGLRSSAFDTNDFVQAITAMAGELTGETSTAESPLIDVEVEGAHRDLKANVRDEAYRIAGEALRNAFRHSNAKRITVKIQFDPRQFQLTVSDDGKGIDDKAMTKRHTGHFGLPGMRERAELFGGKLEVWSKVGSGTQLDLSIPSTLAYDSSARRPWWSNLLSQNGRRGRSDQL